MNRISKPDPEGAAATTIQIANKAKADWLDAWMAKLMPPETYKLAMNLSGGDRKVVRRWMVDNKMELREMPDRAELWMGGKAVGSFCVQFDGGKLNVMAKDFLTGDKNEPNNPTDAPLP